MKNSFKHFVKSIVIGCFLLFSVVIDAQEVKEIAMVENNLLPTNYFRGEKPYNLKERMAFYHVPGVSIAVIKDFKVHWVKHYGVADEKTNQPVTENTLFNVGSCSKGVASLTALSLVEKGFFTLDTDVTTLLKSFELPFNELTKDKIITPRLLMSHTSGIRHAFGVNYSKGSIPTITNRLKALASDKQKRFFDLVPGTQFQYSNPAFGVLQQIIEDCTQKHFYEVVSENVFTKLGMIKSSFKQPLDADFEQYASAGHNIHSPLQEKRYYTPNEAAGGLWTTVDDFAKYLVEIQLSVLNKSNKIISQELAKEMTSPQITDAYGLGLFMRKVAGEDYYGHMGDSRGFFAGFLAHSTSGNAVIVFTNSHESPELIREITKSVAYVYDWKGIAEDPIDVISLSPKSLEKYTGKYRTGSDNSLSISMKGDELIYNALDEKMFCVAQDTFKIKSRAGYIAFKRNADDEIDGVSYMIADELGRMPSNEFSGNRMKQTDLIPSELVLTDNYMAAIDQYKSIFEKNSSDRSVSESRFNIMGYRLLQQKKIESALAIFKLNTELYPNSWNCFDSYGEALAVAGKTDEAIKSYTEAVRLNPAALNSKERLNALLENK